MTAPTYVPMLYRGVQLPASVFRLSYMTAAGALKAYDKAIVIRRKEAAAGKASSAEDGGADAGQLSARLLNNAAVLHLRAGDTQEAFDLMAQAVAAAAGGTATDLDPLSQVWQQGIHLLRISGVITHLATNHTPSSSHCLPLCFVRSP